MERENNIDQFGLRYVFLGGIWIELGTFYFKTKFTPKLAHFTKPATAANFV